MYIVIKKPVVVCCISILFACGASGCMSHLFRGVDQYGSLLALPVDCGTIHGRSTAEEDSKENQTSRHPACKSNIEDTSSIIGLEKYGVSESIVQAAIDDSGLHHEMEYWLDVFGRFHEPVIFDAAEDSEVEIYRFLWRRIPDEDIVVRVQKTSSGVFAVYKKMKSNGVGFRVGIKKVSDVSWREIKNFSLNGFWSRPWQDDVIALGPKQSFWLLEGVKRGKYHIVGATNPCVHCNAAGIVRTAKKMLLVAGLAEELY